LTGQPNHGPKQGLLHPDFSCSHQLWLVGDFPPRSIVRKSPTAIDKTNLLAKMEPGFATSICALRQLCQSLNLSVLVSETGSDVPPETEQSSMSCSRHQRANGNHCAVDSSDEELLRPLAHPRNEECGSQRSTFGRQPGRLRGCLWGRTDRSTRSGLSRRTHNPPQCPTPWVSHQFQRIVVDGKALDT